MFSTGLCSQSDKTSKRPHEKRNTFCKPFGCCAISHDGSSLYRGTISITQSLEKREAGLWIVPEVLFRNELILRTVVAKSEFIECDLNGIWCRSSARPFHTTAFFARRQSIINCFPVRSSRMMNKSQTNWQELLHLAAKLVVTSTKTYWMSEMAVTKKKAEKIGMNWNTLRCEIGGFNYWNIPPSCS